MLINLYVMEYILIYGYTLGFQVRVSCCLVLTTVPILKSPALRSQPHNLTKIFSMMAPISSREP